MEVAAIMAIALANGGVNDLFYLFLCHDVFAINVIDGSSPNTVDVDVK